MVKPPILANTLNMLNKDTIFSCTDAKVIQKSAKNSQKILAGRQKMLIFAVPLLKNGFSSLKNLGDKYKTSNSNPCENKEIRER